MGALRILLQLAGGIDVSEAIPESIPQDVNETTVTNNLVSVALYAAGALAVIMLVYGGIQYITSAGNSSKVEQAKKTIIYSIVGIVVVVLAWGIVSFVTGAIG